MKTYVTASLQVEGLHRWEGCDLKDVRFLRNVHRHIFYINCKKSVSHEDRDIEIILFKRELSDYLQTRYKKDGNCCDFGSMSCEMIAKELLQEFNLDFCSVLEDGENGAEVTKE